MENYRSSSHSVYDLKYHIVWITKYRKPVLRADIAERVRDLIRELCKANEVEIIKGHISRDHVHLFVSAPPHLSVSKLVQYLKGKTSRKIMMEFKSLNRQFWGRHIWARGYFVASSGNVTDEVIIKYIEEQGKEPPNENFKVDDEIL
jgi:putative transposase